MLSEIFYTFLITSLIGCSLTVLKYVYKIKINNISCGCCKITRDINAEEKLEELKIENNTTSSRSEIV